MRITTLSIISLFFIFSCSSQKNTGSTSALKNETELLKQMEYDAIAAEFRLDTTSISRIMHDNFIAVYPDKLQNKQQELTGIYNTMVNRIKEGETMDSLYLYDFRVQFFNNTAIVTFYTVTKGRRKEVPYENRRMRWYDVWVKEKGQWKIVSAQGTYIVPSKN